MTKTYADVQAQIAKLQREAEALREKEVRGVVARIREAIGHYGLKPEDLFDQAIAASPMRARKARVSPAEGQAASKKARGASRVVPIKFKDASGNVWSGRGSQPRWLREALAAGATLESLRV